ncbi:MAG: hypothetical protein JWR80_3992 [Bradyrhizobium sp.]|nr:hypothetical protein [Bradyrhizobium sp.]
MASTSRVDRTNTRCSTFFYVYKQGNRVDVANAGARHVLAPDSLHLIEQPARLDGDRRMSAADSAHSIIAHSANIVPAKM